MRENIKLINFHTLSAETMPQANELSYGEIAIRNNESKAELLIKVNETGFTSIPSSGIVQNLINTAIEGVNTGVTEVEEKLAEIESNYAQTTAMTQAIDTAKADVYSSGVSYTDKALETVNETVGNLEGRVDVIESDYAKTADVTTAITSSKAEVYSSGVSYTDGVIAPVNANITVLSGNVTTIEGEIDALQGDSHTHENKSVLDGINSEKITAWDNAEENAIAAANEYTDTQVESINSKLSIVYKYKGSVNTYAELPTGATVGDVYNVVEANGEIPAGTNYAWNGSIWDALGGSIDLSGYATTGAVQGLETRIASAESSITTLTSSAHNHTNKEILDTVTSQMLTNATNAATSVVVENSDTNKITANILNNVLTLNFDNIVIDCGTF